MMKYSLHVIITCIFLDLGCVEGIVKGSPAKLGEFPYMVVIMWDGRFSGGGSLISDRHVLTAGHCVTNLDDAYTIRTNLSVKVGTVDRTDPSTGIRIEVDKVSPHPGFKFIPEPFFILNDIAVLTLKNSVVVSELVRPIALPEPMEEYSKDTQFIFSGFGSVSVWAPPSKYLKKMTTRAVSQDECQAKWTDMKINPGHLCATHGACNGDSGSPLTIDGKVVVGIESVSDDDCDLGKPNVYTKVSDYIDFISGQMKSTDESWITETPTNVLKSLLHNATTLQKDLVWNNLY